MNVTESIPRKTIADEPRISWFSRHLGFVLERMASREDEDLEQMTDMIFAAHHQSRKEGMEDAAKLVMNISESAKGEMRRALLLANQSIVDLIKINDSQPSSQKESGE